MERFGSVDNCQVFSPTLPLCAFVILGNERGEILPQSSAKINAPLINQTIKRLEDGVVILGTYLEFLLSSLYLYLYFL